MPTIRHVSRRSQFFVMTAGHFVTDIHANFVHTLLPQIISRLGITMAEAGVLFSFSSLMHIIGQPLFGHLADRTGRPFFAALGPVAAALGAGCVLAAPNFGWALFFMALWGIGSAAFHPQGQGSVGYFAPRERLAFAISLFGAAGMLGSTVSPYYALALVHFVGLENLPLATVPAILYAVVLLLLVPRIQEGSTASMQAGLLKTLWEVMKTILPIWIVSVSLDATFQGLRFFLPLFVAERGGSISEVSNTVFAVTLAGTLAGLVGGHASDRVGRPRFVSLMLLLGPFLLIPATFLPGLASIIAYMGGMSCLVATMPVCAAMSQEKAAHARSVASSLVMGVSWGLGGFITIPVGAIGDAFGTPAAMCGLSFVPWLALALFIPLWRRWNRAAEK